MGHEVKHPMVSEIHAVANVVLQQSVPDFNDTILKTWYNRCAAHPCARPPPPS
jgi:hypothetical protein